MKRRNPNTFCGSVDRLKGDLTTAVCADAVKKTTSLVRKWSDEDHDTLPNLEQGYALDELHVRSGLSTPITAPVISVWLNRLRRVAEGSLQALQSVSEELLDVPEVVGRLVSVVREAGKDRNYTPNERVHIKAVIAEVRRELDELEQVVDSSPASVRDAAE